MHDGAWFMQVAAAFAGALVFLKLCADEVARRRENVRAFEAELEEESSRARLGGTHGATVVSAI